MLSGTNNIGHHALLACTSGTNSTAVGYHALLPNTGDHFAVIIQLYESTYCRIYIMLQNQNKLVEVNIIKKNNVLCDRHFVDGDPVYSTPLENAIKHYQIMFPKWLHLYKYFVIMNTIDCCDIFTHLLSFYVSI